MAQSAHPPLEGAGRLTLSAAQCEAGRGDSLSIGRCWTWRDRHPTSVRISCEPILPLQGRMLKLAAIAMTVETHGRKIAAPVVILLSNSVCAFAASFSA